MDARLVREFVAGEEMSNTSDICRLCSQLTKVLIDAVHSLQLGSQR